MLRVFRGLDAARQGSASEKEYTGTTGDWQHNHYYGRHFMMPPSDRGSVTVRVCQARIRQVPDAARIERNKLPNTCHLVRVERGACRTPRMIDAGHADNNARTESGKGRLLQEVRE